MKRKTAKYYPNDNIVVFSKDSDSSEPSLNVVNILTKSITYNFKKETDKDNEFECLTDEEAFNRLTKRLKNELREISDEVLSRLRKLDSLTFDQCKK